MLAKHNIQNPEKEVEAIVLVYHEAVEKNYELMKDLEKKYLSSIVSKMKPKHFLDICEGNG